MKGPSSIHIGIRSYDIETLIPLGSVSCVDMNVIGSEVAGPDTRSAVARAQIYQDWNEALHQAPVSLLLAERVLNAVLASQNARQVNLGLARIELHSRPPGRS